MRANSRLPWVAAAALVVVGGVAALLLERDGALPLLQPIEAAGRREAIEPGLPASDREPAMPARSAASNASPEAEQTARALIESELGVDLALVDAMTKKPRDEAAAWYVDPEKDEADRKKFWHQSDPLVEHCGVALDVDKEAHVRLPDLAEVEVVARSADRFGRATIRRSGGEQQRLLLWPDSPLKVRVVDAAGRPCGDLTVVLDVVFLSQEGRERSRSSLLPPDPLGAGWTRLLEFSQRLASAEQDGLWRGTTSKSNGEAEVSHGARLLVEWSDPDLVARSTALRFRLALPTTDATTVLIDPQVDLHQPVVLVAPTLVKLRVSVVGPDDRPYPYEVRLTSRLAPADAEDDHGDLSDPVAASRARVAASQRKKPFEPRAKETRQDSPAGHAVSKGEDPVEMLVLAGASIEVEAEPADSRFGRAKAKVTAPTSPDVSGDVVVKVAPKLASTPAKRSPNIIGRAIDPDGRPLSDERLGWQNVDVFRRELVHHPEQFVRADHRGIFVIPIPPPLHGRRSVTIRLFDPCPAADSGLDATSSADVEIGDVERDADLGDVRFQRLPLMIAGRVVDPEGHGLPHPTVELWAGSSRPEDRPDATIVAGRQGRFIVHGDTRESSLLVTAELDGWYLPGTTVEPRGGLVLPKRNVPIGSSDVTIDLHRCGVARGELLLDSSVDPSAISLETTPRAPATRVVRDEGNHFRLVGIPGLCDLTARGSGRCLLTLIDRIELREAASTDDARIQPLDMTGVVRMPVLVVDPGGAPIPGASLVLSSNSEGAAATRVFRADPFGREVVVAVQNDGPLLVGAAGFRLKREPLESLSKTIAMASGIAVSASLQGVADVPPQVTVRLTAEYSPARADSDAVKNLLEGLVVRSAERSARDARFDLLLSAPGSWSLVVTFADSAKGAADYLVPEPGFVTVADVGEAQHLDLRISDEALRWVIEKLER